MAYRIVVKVRFRKKVVKLLVYLENEWGKTVADEFLKKVDSRLEILSQYPFVGNSTDKSETVRTILITKHNSL